MDHGIVMVTQWKCGKSISKLCYMGKDWLKLYWGNENGMSNNMRIKVENCDTFGLLDVEIALSKMLSGKAPAIDKVTSDMIKAAGLIGIQCCTEHDSKY
jgi:hypothetical protein